MKEDKTVYFLDASAASQEPISEVQLVSDFPTSFSSTKLRKVRQALGINMGFPPPHENSQEILMKSHIYFSESLPKDYADMFQVTLAENEI